MDVSSPESYFLYLVACQLKCHVISQSLGLMEGVKLKVMTHELTDFFYAGHTPLNQEGTI